MAIINGVNDHGIWTLYQCKFLILNCQICPLID